MMRLTSFTDFGLRALMRMASAPDRAFSTADLATEFALSRNHLTKIITALAAAGILTTRRGGGGGAMLARPPKQILLGDVVRVLEAGQPLVDCFSPGGGICSIATCCGLKSRLRSAESAFLADLDRSTLADVALPPLAVLVSGH
jgi:Rrf2 family nitric oxide-sensitive transcriptional repressor